MWRYQLVTLDYVSDLDCVILFVGVFPSVKYTVANGSANMFCMLCLFNYYSGCMALPFCQRFPHFFFLLILHFILQ